MAEALVGGAALQAVFAVLFERLTPNHAESCSIANKILNFIRGKKLDNNVLRRLMPSLNAARSVLNDAELKQFKDPAVRDWLDDLRDAAYQVEDFMDDLSTHKQVCNNLSSASLTVRDTDMANKLEAITAEIEFIVAQKDSLGLKTSVEHKNLSHRPQSTSSVDVSEVCGRGKETDDIIKLISDNNDKLSVIPIVGMGGIGKTTLAQLVYNGDYVEQNFEIKAWVCVSEQFDRVKITETILRSIDRSHAFDNMDLNLLQLDLEEKLSKKKFLIVLDDVWNWNDMYTEWKNLMIPFQKGLEGSKIIVTTRIKEIASMVRTIETPYCLALLSDEECLSLFAIHALRSSDPPSLSSWVEKFGGDIVSKCRGLPLAAKALGALFRARPDVQHWNNILKNDIWDLVEDAMVPALRVSYDYLPPHLKRCIVYCSLFPKDYEFDKEDLILMWMAEGFLQAPNRGMMTLEEVGYDYFDDLTARSFFQPCIERHRHFVMHDLFHDLTILVGRDFFFRLEKEGDGNKIRNRARHMSYINLNFPSAFDIESLKGAKALRTIIGFDSEWLPKSIGKTIMSLDLRYLRVLSFRKFRALKVLPDSVGEYLHLRYLDLSYTALECLPNSVCKLYNLQTLKLNDCSNLKMLPDDMQDLVNLRCLEIGGTSLEEMPRGMGKLKKLQILDKFDVGKVEGSTIQELEEIEDLTGSFQIFKLENIKNCDEAQTGKMMRKKKINSLSLCWSNDDCINDSKTENDIIDKLQPHQDLQSLRIWNYKGTMFPNWLGHVSYYNMTNLELEDCKNCWMLPPLGQLPALTHLTISGLEKVVSMGAEFYKGDDCASPVIPFSSLEVLVIRHMAALEKWHSTEIEAFPKLQRVIIYRCPKLIGDLPCELLSLTSLDIHQCPLLASCIPKCPKIQLLEISSGQNVVFQDDELPPSLSTLSISGDGMLESVLEAMPHSTIPNLKQLHLRDCCNAISLPVTCLPPSVKQLCIFRCKHVEFPKQQCHVSLETLSIQDSCDTLTSLSSIQIFPHLKSLSVVRCENLISVLTSNTPPLQNLQSISIRSCKNLKRLCHDESTICILPNLKSLQISYCPEVEAFPTEIFPHLNSLCVRRCENLTSVLALSSNTTPLQDLQSLSIESCKNLKRLCHDDSIDCILPNLKSLHIVNCEEVLAHHREWHLPSSLTSLTIRYDGNIKCFPAAEGCSLPTTLSSLTLFDLPNLEKLNCEGLQHLTSLHELKIYDCPKLEKFTGQMLPTSLTKLIIAKCDLLEEQCRNKDNEIWPKISHIPAIRLTHEWISFDTTFHRSQRSK